MEREKQMARVNTRITKSQQEFVKAEAKRTGKTEGEVFRAILEDFIQKDNTL